MFEKSVYFNRQIPGLSTIFACSFLETLCYFCHCHSSGYTDFTSTNILITYWTCPKLRGLRRSLCEYKTVLWLWLWLWKVISWQFSHCHLYYGAATGGLQTLLSSPAMLLSQRLGSVYRIQQICDMLKAYVKVFIKFQDIFKEVLSETSNIFFLTPLHQNFGIVPWVRPHSSRNFIFVISVIQLH